MCARFATVLAAAVLISPATAQEAPEAAAPTRLEALYDAVQMDRHVASFQQSQIAFWQRVRARDFPGQGGTAWVRAAIEANSLAQIETDFTEGFLSVGFPEAMMERTIEAYGSPFGQYLQDRAFETVALFAEAETLEETVEAAAAAGDPSLDVIDTILLLRGTVEDDQRFYRDAEQAYYQALAAEGALWPDAGGVAGLMAEYDAAQTDAVLDGTRDFYRGFFFLFAEEMDDAALLDWLAFATSDWALAYDHAFQTGVRHAYVASAARLGRAAAPHVAAAQE